MLLIQEAKSLILYMEMYTTMFTLHEEVNESNQLYGHLGCKMFKGVICFYI